VSKDLSEVIGRVLPAPENHLSAEKMEEARKARRSFMGKALAMGAGVAATTTATTRAMAAEGEEAILKLPAHTVGLGQPVAMEGYGKPSKWEGNLQRRESPGLTRVSQASVSFTPLQGLFGIITPSGLHFERHHQGWWDIDPSKHRLMINGLVKRERVFTMDDLMRLPSVSRIHFIECGANSAPEWGNVVLLSTLLEMCGYDKKNGKYVLAEGADGSSMTRTIAIDQAMDDCLVAWAMNGEMLRPENGYPLRLVVPGVQGVSWVKYLRRIEVGDMKYATKDEAVHYIDHMPDGTHGFYNITGLAWSGRGAIKRVDVSVDGGRNWRTARMEGPVLPKALTRFNIDWVWDGKPAILQSRAIDSTGYVQPKINQLRAVRGTKSVYHQNAIQSWKVSENGEVSNVQVF